MSDAEVGKNPRGKVGKVVRWAAVAVVAALVLLGVLARPGRRLDAWAGERVRAAVESALGRPVAVDAVHVSFLPAGATIRGLVVRAAPPSDRAVLTIPDLSVSLALRALLQGRIEISRVRVDRPVVAVWHENGRWEGPFPVATEPSRLEIVLDRVEVADGAVSFEGRTLPLRCLADDIRLDWTSGGSGGRGTLDAGRLAVGEDSATPLLGRAHLEGALEGTQARATGSLSSGGSTLRLDASADVPSRDLGAVSGEIRIEFDVADAAEIRGWPALLGLASSPSGRLAGKGTLRFAPAGWSGEGRLHGERLRYEGLEVEALDAELAATEKAVTIRGLVARTLGGSIRADGRFEPWTGGELHAALRADDLSLDSMLSFAGIDAALDGLASFDGTLSARLGDSRSVGGAGTFRIASTGSAAGRGRLDAEAEGEIRVDGRAVTATASSARVGSTSGTIVAEKSVGTPGLRLVLDVVSGSLGDSARLVEALFFHARDRGPFPIDPSRLSGNGSASGEIVLGEEKPSAVRLDFDLDDVAFEGIEAGALSGTLLAREGELSFDGTVARKGGGSFAVAEAVVPLGSGAPWHVSGRFEHWPAGDLLSRAGLPGSPTARIDGRAELGAGGRGWTGSADLSITEGKAGPFVFESGRFEGTMLDSVVRVDRLDLLGSGGSVSASGTYDIGASSLSGSLRASRVDASLASPWLRGIPLAGQVSISLDGESAAATTKWSGSLAPDPEVSLAGHPVEGLSLTAEGDAVRARVRARIGAGTRIESEVALAGSHECTGRLDLDAVRVSSVAEFVRPGTGNSVGGEITGSVTWSGPLDDPAALRATAEFHPLRIAVGSETFTDPAPIRISLTGGRVSFDEVSLVSGASRLEIAGAYPLDPARTDLDLSVNASADLSALTAFFRGLTSAGTLTLGVRATGSPSAPDLAGKARLEGGRVRMAGGSMLAADRLQAEARIERGAIRIETISGTLAGGSLSGKGTVTLAGLEPTALILEGNVGGATIEIPAGFRGLYSGELRFEAAAEKAPSLTGRLDLVRGVWRRNFELDRVNLLARTRVPVVEVPRPDEGMDRTTLDVKIEANDNLWLRNDLADAEAWGRIEVKGTVGHPQVAGHCETLEGGELRFGKVRYQLEQARVDIPAAARIDPEFDIVASTRVREYDIRMHLWGNASRVDSELTSNPALAERDIFSLLLTGSTTDEAGGGARAGTLEGSAASLVGGQLGTLVGSHLERWLGFEEVRIDPYQYTTTGDPTTRVTLGKRLFPRVFVRTSIPLNSTETTTYEVKYQVNRKTEVSAFRTDRDALGGGARYSTRTWSPHARARRRESSAGMPLEEKTVSEVSFAGDFGGDSAALARLVPHREGDRFDRKDLAMGVGKLKKHFVKNGYLEASIIASSRDVGAGRFAVEYRIERGPKVELTIAGAGDSEKLVRALLDALWLEPSSYGSDLEEEAAYRIRRALKAEGFFDCDVQLLAETTAGARKLTFRVDRREKVRVAGLTIVGASGIPASEVKGRVLSGRETRFRHDLLKPELLEEDVATVENLYRSRGYLAARAAWKISLMPGGKEADVEIQVDEGPRATLRTVAIRGNEAVPEERLRPLVKSREGEFLDAGKVYEDLLRLRSLYDAAGYLDARIEEDLRSDGENVDLTFVIAEGREKTLHNVEIEGNRFTHDSVIRRLVPLKEGDPISQDAIQKIRTDLSRSGLFSDVRVSWEDAGEPDAGQTLKIAVSEANDLILGAGAGYDTYNGPRVQLDAAETNLEGSGWYSGLSLLYGSKVQRQQLTFRAPRALRGWMPILGATHYDEVRDAFTQTGTALSAALERKTATGLTHIVRYAASSSNVHDLKISEDAIHATEPRLDLGQVRLGSVGYAIARDRRDSPLNTTRGTYVSADLRAFSEIFGSQQQFSKLFLQGSAVGRLPWGWIGITGAKVGFASRLGTVLPLPLQERYFAGGASTFRGFSQDRLGYVEVQETVDGEGNPLLVDTGTLQHGTLRPLGGESVVILNSEIRRSLYGGVSAILFWDAGSVFPTPGDIRLDRFRNSAGTGLRFDTPIGPIRVEYGWKLDPHANESAGEYVFTIGQSF